MAQGVGKLRQGFCAALGGKNSLTDGDFFFFRPSKGLVRPTTPWRFVCFILSSKTASVLSHIYRKPTQHLSSTLPPLTQDSHTSAHFLISHFSWCLPYPWSDLHRSSAPQVSPPPRSLGSHCEPPCLPMAVSLSQLPGPKTAQRSAETSFFQGLTDPTGAMDTEAPQDRGLGCLETLSFRGQVHGAKAHPAWLGLRFRLVQRPL